MVRLWELREVPASGGFSPSSKLKSKQKLLQGEHLPSKLCVEVASESQEDASLGLCLKEIHSWPQHPLSSPAASLQTRCLTASGSDPRLDVIKCDLPSYSSSLFLFFIKSLCLPLATWSETMTHLFINSSAYTLLSHSLLLYILCLCNFHD